MKLRVEVVSIRDDGQEQRSDVMELERERLVTETLGLNLSESKAMLEGVQEFMVAQQAAQDLARRRICAQCGERHGSKEGRTISVKTLFGMVKVPNPRWNRCGCESPRKDRRRAGSC